MRDFFDCVVYEINCVLTVVSAIVVIATGTNLGMAMYFRDHPPTIEIKNEPVVVYKQPATTSQKPCPSSSAY